MLDILWILIAATTGYSVGWLRGYFRRGTRRFWFELYLNERRDTDELKRQLHEAQHRRYDALYRDPPGPEQLIAGGTRALGRAPFEQ